ncbi:hypothetical protein OD917_22435 [Flavobacterium sp. SH_e]|uniref:hypothetical protein n=1 Tax=Flavobacterium sp. SH_e TaxID=2983767 RepID=UPI0021E418B9|nr:hypothetical protein [Flavobacterium sp. SH_e]MCV2487706.1 hypothetical protein [Flavobacterium sp. SH_e]
MKKFKIKNTGKDSWPLSHNEFPKFTCDIEDKIFNCQSIVTGLPDPLGDLNEIQLPQKMENA